MHHSCQAACAASAACGLLAHCHVQDPKSKIPKDDPNLLKNRGILDRAIVLSAGVVANTVFAWSILFAQVSTYDTPALLDNMQAALASCLVRCMC